MLGRRKNLITFFHVFIFIHLSVSISACLISYFILISVKINSSHSLLFCSYLCQLIPIYLILFHIFYTYICQNLFLIPFIYIHISCLVYFMIMLIKTSSYHLILFSYLSLSLSCLVSYIMLMTVRTNSYYSLLFFSFLYQSIPIYIFFLSFF